MQHNHGCFFCIFQRPPAPIQACSLLHKYYQQCIFKRHGKHRRWEEDFVKRTESINDKPCVLILTAILLHNVISWACFITVPVDKLFPWMLHPRSCGVTVSTLDFKSSVTGSNLAGTYQIFFGTKSSLFEIIFFTWMNKGSHGVMVSTLDSESSDPSSNLGGT